MKEPTRDQLICFLYLFIPIFIWNAILLYLLRDSVPNIAIAIIHGPMLGLGVIFSLPFGLFLRDSYDQIGLMLMALGALFVTPIIWSLIFYYPYRRFIYLKWKK